MAEYKCLRTAFHSAVQFFDILLVDDRNCTVDDVQILGAAALGMGMKLYVLKSNQECTAV